MREHEVPTHVQAEDRVLLWFTFPADRGYDGCVRPVLRRVQLRPRRPRGGSDGHSRRPGARGRRGHRGKDWRSAAAIGCRRPAEVLAGGAALRPGLRPNWRGASPPRPRRAAQARCGSWPGGRDGALRRRPKENRKKRKEGERRNGRMPLRWFGKRRRRKGGEGSNANLPAGKAGGQPGRYTGDQASQVMAGRAGRRRPGGSGRRGPAVGAGRRPLARRDRVPAHRAGPRTENIRRGGYRCRETGQT